MGGLPLDQGGRQAHTIVDLRGAIPVFVHITTGKVHDVNVLDLIHWPAGAIAVVDRGYLDFARLQSLHQRQVSFVIRARTICATPGSPRASRQIDGSAQRSERILLATPKIETLPRPLAPRVSFRDPETDKFLVFLTNRFDLPALTIAEIYRKRWQVETFSSGSEPVDQAFLRTSLSAVKSQISGSPSASISSSSSRASD
ncbi:MAG: transposase [Rhodocyclaceae bacterium]